MSSTHAPYDAPNWLAPASPTCFPADGQTQLDFDMEGPWFLTASGLMSRDCSRAHNEMEWLPGETRHGSDQADFPVYSAGSFGMALKYLPRVNCLERSCERQLDGSFQWTDTVYFVVEGRNRFFTDGSPPAASTPTKLSPKPHPHKSLSYHYATHLPVLFRPLATTGRRPLAIIFIVSLNKLQNRNTKVDVRLKDTGVHALRTEQLMGGATKTRGVEATFKTGREVYGYAHKELYTPGVMPLKTTYQDAVIAVSSSSWRGLGGSTKPTGDGSRGMGADGEFGKRREDTGGGQILVQDRRRAYS
ncbi:hypothetical protein B0H14DRAFT_2648648 [Mycena olivaceomarginata]|nr:hypothetical protein B0H14DRAFT_2648648 [Mycena olivaceomarginata]